MEFIILTPLIAIFVFAVYFAVEYAKRKRREGVALFASELSLEYRPLSLPTDLGITVPFQLLSLGRSKEISNVVVADTQDTVAVMFDYKYVTGGGKNSATHRLSVVFFSSKLLNTPDFTMRPERWFHRLGQVFGIKDINFQSHPVFSSQFLLQASDENAIRSWMSMNRLTALEKHKDTCIESMGSQCLIYKTMQVQPRNLRAWLEEAFTIFSILSNEK